MKIVKWVAVVLGVYIGIIVAFESLLGYFQPAGETTLVIATTGEDGAQSDRVLARLESGGLLYVAANHWPRAWYDRALVDPNVEVTLAGVPGKYVAAPVTGEEHERVDADNSLGVAFRILTGFPPRYFLRLDPQ